MAPMAVTLIFAWCACFLAIDSVLCQAQNQGGQTNHQFQHEYAFGNSYAYKWQVPFTYTYTIPPFTVDATQYTQYRPEATQGQSQQPQQIDVGSTNNSPSSTQEQQQPISLKSRFGGDDIELENQQEGTTAKSQTRTRSVSEPNQNVVRVPIRDDEGNQIGWQYTTDEQLNKPAEYEPQFESESGVGSTPANFVPQTVQVSQTTEATQIAPTRPKGSGSNSDSLPYPPHTKIQILFPSPPPTRSPSPSPTRPQKINQNEQTGLAHQPAPSAGHPNQSTNYEYNSRFGPQPAGAASGAPDIPKMCTAQQIYLNLCPGVAFTAEIPSAGDLNFLTSQQSKDIEKFLQSLHQNMFHALSTVQENARFTPVSSSGVAGRPVVVAGAAIGGGPGGSIHTYTYANT